jgi:hypothetical protein
MPESRKMQCRALDFAREALRVLPATLPPSHAIPTPSRQLDRQLDRFCEVYAACGLRIIRRSGVFSALVRKCSHAVVRGAEEARVVKRLCTVTLRVRGMVTPPATAVKADECFDSGCIQVREQCALAAVYLNELQQLALQLGGFPLTLKHGLLTHFYRLRVAPAICSSHHMLRTS